jgi:delta 1-pyrroline-5-carboxylate dehydrogenase
MEEKELELNAQPAPVEEESVEEESQVADIDYDSELKDLVAKNAILENERDNYKKGLLIAKGKIEDDTVDRDTKLFEEMKALREQIATLATTSIKPTVETVLDSLTSNAGEKNLIKWYYDNKIIKSGTSNSDIQADLEDAMAMANKKKILKQNEELKIAAKNKSQISNMPDSSGGDEVEVKTSKWTKEQIADLKKRGLDPDKVWENYKKKLVN